MDRNLTGKVKNSEQIFRNHLLLMIIIICYENGCQTCLLFISGYNTHLNELAVTYVN